MSERRNTRHLWLVGLLLLLLGGAIGWLAFGAYAKEVKPAGGPSVSADLPPGGCMDAPADAAPKGSAERIGNEGQPENAVRTEPNGEAEAPAPKNPDVLDVSLWVTYADDEPFVGTVRLRFGAREKRDIEMTSTQPALVEALDVSKGLDVSLESRRAGFLFDECIVSAAELRQNPEVYCIVPASDEPNATITVDVSRFDPNENVWLRIEDDTGYTVLDCNTWKGGAKYTSSVIRVIRPSRYRVVVMADKVWQSEWIYLRAGENVEVAAEPLDPATITVRPVDASGAPLLAAILYRETGRYCDQSDLRPNPGSARSGIEASPDKDGVATLTNLAPGNQTVCVQGQGTEIVRFDLMLIAGSVFDLGVVGLAPAAGQVEVTLTGADSDAGFSLELLQPMRSPIMDPTPFSGSRAEIENLPLRKYTAAVRIKATGRCYWKTVELTELAPRAVIEFDVSKPPPDEG